ncbi:hypothetical protein PGT21_016894 [Puccinia graminis f. sp. tritici]|nr:hypothetical protein PGT21_016894 [Puccinia graminis f. sp. tritici]
MTALQKAYLTERKRKNRSKKHAEERTSELSLTLDNTERRQTIAKCGSINPHLDEPPVVQPNNEATNADEEFEYCNNLVKNFRLFDHGKVVIHDKKDKSKIIALIEFTPFDKLTPNDLADINYITRFLHSSKQFVNAVGSESRSWGGRMFAIGWRKAMVGFQLIGLYRNKAAINRSPQAYGCLMKKSERASSILGRLFRRLANVAFTDNQEIMKENSIPSIGQPDFGIHLGEDNCAPNLTFTSDDFFNSPHCDTEDLSEFAFGLFTPVNKGNWSLPSTSQMLPTPGRAFVFPDYRCGIDLSKNSGVVKMVWRAKEVRHCTLYSANNSAYDQIGMSLQINKKTAKTAHDIKSGSIYERPAFKDVLKDKLYIVVRVLYSEQLPRGL